MWKIVTIVFIVLIYIKPIWGQGNNLLIETYKPTSKSKPSNAEVDNIGIYDNVLVIRLVIENPINNTIFSVQSNSEISYCYPAIYEKIIGFIPYEGSDEFLILNHKYNLAAYTKKVGTTLIFPRVPPGIEKIDLELLSENKSYRWIGLSFKNPDNHPKTSWTEQSLKNEWKNKGISAIEGIYETAYISEISPTKYRLALKKEKENLQLIYLSGAENSTWKVGEIKAYLYESATPSLYKVIWYTLNKVPDENGYITFEEGLMKKISTIKENPDPESLFIKLYPTSSNENSPKKEQASGTGFALTSYGLIVTNNHVIEGTNKISVRGINGQLGRSYNAKVVITDKKNDLAIIKIEDESFTHLDQIPYIIRSVIASTGENVFVLGYPLRSSMGDEIKLTNGIISSKSGYQGDITSYQISVPVQPGNSGGPLFDSQGKLIGIINAKLVGAENASYAVKVSFLKNLIEILDNPPTLQSINSLNGKTLPQQVEILKKFVYIIEVQ